LEYDLREGTCLGVAYGSEEYLGRNLAWRIVFLCLSVVVSLMFFIVFACSYIAYDFAVRVSLYPTIAGLVVLYNQLSTIQFPLVVGLLFFGPWLSCFLVSVCSHPVNAPVNLRWFGVGVITSCIVTAIGIQWTYFIPTLLTLPQLPYNYLSVASFTLVFLSYNLAIGIVISLVSILVWFRWVTW
jgi:hypothetical protein